MDIIENLDITIVILLTIVIIVSSIVIVIAIKIQHKQRKIYKECVRLIEAKENGTFEIGNGLTEDEMKKINKKVNVQNLMKQLYETYIFFVTNLNSCNKNALTKLSGFIREYYVNKIDIYTQKGHREIIDSIELINYSILEYSKNKIKFRINFGCLSYKTNNGVVISGSNQERVEQVTIVTFVKVSRKWLINNIEKVYEKKMS